MHGKRLARITRSVGRLVFSRFMVIALLFVLQIAVFVSIVIWFSERLPWFAAVEQVFTVIMVLYLFNCRMDSSAKLTWMVLIAVFPLPAAGLLVYTRTETGKRRIRRNYEEKVEQSRGLIRSGCPEDDGNVPSGMASLSRYMQRGGAFPAYAGAEVTYYPLGDETIPAMIREMEKAEHFIFMEFFIVSEGHVWDQVMDVLRRKARQGVDVRLMYDGMCDVTGLPRDFQSRLRREGVKVKAFFPLTAFVSTYYNYRDHRKILAVDNRVAFTGGVNLADEYANETVRFGHWKDTAVCVRGEPARSFTLMFLQMWNLNDVHADYTQVHLGTNTDGKAAGWVLPYADCPLDGDKVGESVYLDMLYRAEKYVHIMTPYLILDGEMETALTYAAERGVDVKIILPGIPDKKAAYALAKSHYRTLTQAGVHLYEYVPGFVHAKVVSSDDEKAVVGTINFDYRSLYHHFECALYMHGTDCIADIEKDFADTLAKCRPVTMESIRAEKLGYKLAGSVLKLVAPLM